MTDGNRKFKEIRVKEWHRHCPQKIEAEKKRTADFEEIENVEDDVKEPSQESSGSTGVERG